jgi:hypothetical protein
MLSSHYPEEAAENGSRRPDDEVKMFQGTRTKLIKGGYMMKKFAGKKDGGQKVRSKLVPALLLLSLFVCRTIFAAGSDPLLDKLVEKGTLTKEEALEIQSKETDQLPDYLKGLSVGGLAYIDYSFGTKNENNTHFNQFSLTRGYINIKDTITPWLKARITPDIYTATDGSTVLRMKYVYVDYLTPDFGPLTGNDIRIGLGHTPWLDFEESINRYRMQGTMFQERSGVSIQNSADFGASILGNFGGTLSKEAQDAVGSSNYAGKYGTYHIGVYNGSGYHAAETNQDKPVEGRITLRPLPEVVPGLQFTYFGIRGKGNTAVNPNKWIDNTGLVSYQNKIIVLTAEYVGGKGEQAGTDEKRHKGYSFFGDFRLPFYDKVSVFGRYDNWTNDVSQPHDKQLTTIAGAGYKLYKDNYIVVAYEKIHYQQVTPTKSDDKKGQVVWQVSF